MKTKPAPTWGHHRSVGYMGKRLGGITEIRPGVHVGVCDKCHQRLAPRATPNLADGLLLTHWQVEHLAQGKS